MHDPLWNAFVLYITLFNPGNCSRSAKHHGVPTCPAEKPCCTTLLDENLNQTTYIILLIWHLDLTTLPFARVSNRDLVAIVARVNGLAHGKITRTSLDCLGTCHVPSVPKNP